MAVFTYKAVDQDGRSKRGQAVVEDEVNLADYLEEQGLILLSAKASRESRPKGQYRHSVPTKEVINFTHHLIMIFSSGIPLLTGLREVAVGTQHPGMKKVLSDLVQRVEAGQPMTQAFAQYPKVFDDTYLGLLEAGEESGRLDTVMSRLVEHLEWRQETRGTVGQAMIYPAILSLAVCGLIMILLTFLLPRIAAVFDKIDAELPQATQILLRISDFTQSYFVFMLGGALILVVAFLVTYSTSGGRRRIDRSLLRVPLFGALVRKSNAAQFSHTLGTLYDSGVSLPRSLDIVAQSLPNRWLGAAVQQSSSEVVEGKLISESLRATKAFQPLVIRMITVGEETGALGDALKRVNRFFDREVPQAVKRMIALLEPTIIIASGLVVSFIVLCTLLPIFRLFSALRGG